MFLHVGADRSVRSDDIIAIIDLRAADLSPATREFLTVMKDEGVLEDISEGDPKSFVIINDRVYLSPISALTLSKRTIGVPAKLL
ncbi:MAG: DUF370 domain-containing protein [Bacillota bacterium]|jgi:hypothetical protein|nr:DUF370 domain-containing protein [Bacillota bacterium]